MCALFSRENSKIRSIVKDFSEKKNLKRVNFLRHYPKLFMLTFSVFEIFWL